MNPLDLTKYLDSKAIKGVTRAEKISNRLSNERNILRAESIYNKIIKGKSGFSEEIEKLRNNRIISDDISQLMQEANSHQHMSNMLSGSTMSTVKRKNILNKLRSLKT